MPAAEAFTKPSVPPARSPDRALLASLRARIACIGGAGVERPREALPLGVAAIDSVLSGGGLSRGCLHEIVAADAGGAAAAFAAVLLAGLAGEDGSVVWCRRDSGLHATKLYGPGLAAFGLDLRRLLIVRVRRETEVLWAMEEGLRSGAVAAVLGEVTATPGVALRRLQLAAETAGTTGLLLRPLGASAAAGSATTRWRVASASSGWGEGARLPAVRWRVELLRCRAATPAGWLVDWCHETHRLGVAAELRNRSVAPAAADPDRRAAV
jgi:protein ImuA